MYLAYLLIQPLFNLQISDEWSRGVFVIKPGDEDIHTANERRLKVRQSVSALHNSAGVEKVYSTQEYQEYLCIKLRSISGHVIWMRMNA